MKTLEYIEIGINYIGSKFSKRQKETEMNRRIEGINQPLQYTSV